jgi:hypothetical protein
MSKDDKSPEEFNGITFTDCDFSNNGKGGAKLGAGNYKFINSKTNNNGGDGIEMGEGAKASFEKHESKGNEGFAISTLTDAIKKPRANNNKGLKIIVGFILTCIIAPLIVGVSLELWKEHRVTTSQEQPRSIQLKEVSGSDQI